MKTLKFTAIVLGLFSLLAGTTTLVRAQDYQDSYQDDGYSTGNVSLQTFYDELSPYGTWIQDPQYGYVWRPDIDQNEFRPYYTNGRWAMTEYGNTWVSNYDWGWAPFHYGRWVINSYRQWIWLPDTNWGPAWVDWRSGDGYYGWAPMAPSISINLSFGRRYSVPEFCWNFIPQASIYINTFPRYDYGRNNVYIRNTTIINNTYVYNRRSYYGGPRMEDIRRATNRDVRVYRFDQSNRPGASRIDSRAVSIYRPRPERNAIDNRNAAPRKFEQGNAGFARNGRGNDNATRGNNNADNRFGNRNDNRTGQTDGRNDGTVDNRDNNNQPNTRGGVYNRDANGRGDRIGQNNGQANVDRNQDQQRAQQAQQQRAERGGQQDRMGQDQQRAQRDVQTQQQRGQQADQQRVAQMEQQRAQRDAQIQQQRGQQADQQRAQQVQQRSAQMEQQRAQRDAQAQQQRSQQADQQRAQQAQQRSAQVEQQRAQRDAQAQQQRSQQAEQQRAQQAQQREAQVQQQRAQQQQQQQQRSEQRRVEAPQQQQQNRGGERSGSEGRPSRGGRG